MPLFNFKAKFLLKKKMLKLVKCNINKEKRTINK